MHGKPKLECCVMPGMRVGPDIIFMYGMGYHIMEYIYWHSLKCHWRFDYLVHTVTSIRPHAALSQSCFGPVTLCPSECQCWMFLINSNASLDFSNDFSWLSIFLLSLIRVGTNFLNDPIMSALPNMILKLLYYFSIDMNVNAIIRYQPIRPIHKCLAFATFFNV